MRFENPITNIIVRGILDCVTKSWDFLAIYKYIISDYINNSKDFLFFLKPQYFMGHYSQQTI
jgi:hypothetical protein